MVASPLCAMVNAVHFSIAFDTVCCSFQLETVQDCGIDPTAMTVDHGYTASGTMEGMVSMLPSPCCCRTSDLAFVGTRAPSKQHGKLAGFDFCGCSQDEKEGLCVRNADV